MQIFQTLVQIKSYWAFVLRYGKDWYLNWDDSWKRMTGKGCFGVDEKNKRWVNGETVIESYSVIENISITLQFRTIPKTSPPKNPSTTTLSCRNPTIISFYHSPSIVHHHKNITFSISIFHFLYSSSMEFYIFILKNDMENYNYQES